MELDKIDRSILRILQIDGKISNVDLANKVGLSESACLRRVKNLHENKIIQNYVALLNPNIIGVPGSVFVRVSLDHQQQSKLAQFEVAVQDVEEVMECYLMSGDVDYMLRVAVKDAPDYERIHNILSALPAVARIHTSFAIRTVLKKTNLPV
ncbi:Lrp/AsnC family transcriptional regulator [Kordiimonas sp. SCSIO 12610]|uniref:Lrp/AsnC family transcriptional regulator n=1 Tax=Kordiimonas sp. SCSIO 12610 TaxID=2829597 RepID=UPI00210BC2F1|nr:Lrp/AsnC family transcriptional regulator [Kordiimonas sp. SCSIO 12610]UTW56789.1 Lrp/AsnC family transcriptional regulator [Kordiimonas sp. SCSIO 12610]